MAKSKKFINSPYPVIDENIPKNNAPIVASITLFLLKFSSVKNEAINGIKVNVNKLLPIILSKLILIYLSK